MGNIEGHCGFIPFCEVKDSMVIYGIDILFFKHILVVNY